MAKAGLLSLWRAARPTFTLDLMSKEATARGAESSRPIRLRDLGPGLLTGVADDDPSNIATYSQVGARFGYQMIWTLWAFYPLISAV